MKKERSTFGWIMAFAGQKRSGYIASVLFAVAGAAFQILPFFVMAHVIGKLLAGDRDLPGYLADCAVMAAFWLLRVLLHSLSTAQSHKATFAVLGNIRRQGLAKLARMPLGDVQATGSGQLKSILVKRVDSIEPTLAHVIPEMSSNAAVALAVLIYLFVIDWRMALASLITFPLGMVFFLLMMAGYNKNYARTVAATNALNDTAVEYIGGIEVIKVFGKAKSSYEKFVTAAQECARSYIDWMNKSNFYFTFAMNIMPATLLSVLLIGGLLLKNAPIVILDEATAYTDPENEAVIQQSVASLVRGKTLIVIAHRLSTIVDADQIVVVNDGRIEAAGTQAELLRTCPLYQALWNAHTASRDSAEGGADRA